ncbi:MAG: hypothetical protein AUK35_04735 [Zetaproteobacteria bacterium CG2_30_46_52]|nr:MAG: hypothetical protein AUK35_04735 [Zetaproteobacteria bacterium CG2_30_46_52]
MFDSLPIHRVSTMPRGLGYAVACFETFRVIDDKIFAWDKHWLRLSQGLQAYGLTLPESAQQYVFEAVLEYCQGLGHDCLSRITIAAAEAPWGLLQHSKLECFIQAQAYSQPFALHNLHSIAYPYALRPKVAKFTSDYAETLRAIEHMRGLHPDIKPADYLWCHDGFIISGLTANVLLYVQGQWLTPNNTAVLPGIMRDYFITQGWVEAMACPVALLHACEAMVLSNCGQFIQPVAYINHRELDERHPAINQLSKHLASNEGVSL